MPNGLETLLQVFTLIFILQIHVHVGTLFFSKCECTCMLCFTSVPCENITTIGVIVINYVIGGLS